MNIDNSLQSLLGLIANIASILTAFVAIYWFFINKQKDYFISEVPGDYKIYGDLRGQESATVLHHLQIASIAPEGWFFGTLEYKEFPEGSEGSCSFIGKIDYSYWRLVVGWLWRKIRFKPFHPLEVTSLASFHGKIYFISRNDFDVSKRNWRAFIVQEYSVIHYRQAYRFKLYNPTKSETWLQVPDELTLVNINKAPDSIFE